MIDVKKYATYRQAENDITKSTGNYVALSHNFPKGTIVKPHFHPLANEWLIVDSGRFTASLDSETQEFEIDSVTVIKFPAKHVHSLKTLSDVSYVVLRDSKDETMFLQTLIRNYNKSQSHKSFSNTIYKTDGMQINNFRIPVNAIFSMGYIGEKSLYRVQLGTGQVSVNDDLAMGEKLSRNKFSKVECSGNHKLINLGRIPLEGIVISYDAILK